MKNIIVLFGLFIFCFIQVLSQSVNDHELNKPKVSFKQIESYETYFYGDKENRIKGTRNLSGITKYNEAGKATEMIIFSNDGNGAYYEKQVYFYDSQNRKTSTDFYISSKAKPNKYFFSEDKDGENYIFLMSQLNETLSKRIFYNYYDNDLKIEEITTDTKGNISEKKVFVYNSNGKMIKLSISNSDKSPTVEIITDYKDNGKLGKTVRIENGVENYKSTIYFDDEGRETKEDQFMPKKPAAKENVKSFSLSSSSTYIYTNDRTNLEWMFFNENGSPREKLIIIDKNDEEFSRERFEYLILSDISKPVWKFAEREIKEYEYDKYGNWTKCVWLKQDGENEPLLPTSIYERTISYH